MLTEMRFTLQLDREPAEKIRHILLPGGYCLNGKDFDFSNVSYTPLEGNRVRCEAYNFDYDFFREAARDNDKRYYTLSEKDVRNGKFSEFFVYNGYEKDCIGYTGVISVSDLEFEFDDGSVIRPKNNSIITQSANDSLAVEISR